MPAAVLAYYFSNVRITLSFADVKRPLPRELDVVLTRRQPLRLILFTVFLILRFKYDPSKVITLVLTFYETCSASSSLYSPTKIPTPRIFAAQNNSNVPI